MKKINFSKMEIFTDISHEHRQVADFRKDFANIIYRNGSGIEALSLAMKIYQSEGDTEYDEKECEAIIGYANMCAPYFVEAIGNQLK